MREADSIYHRGCEAREGQTVKNRDANDLSLERRHNREGAYMDPNIMPTGMTR